MKSGIFLLMLCVFCVLASCTKDVYDAEKQKKEPVVPTDFEWKTLQTQKLTITATSHVFTKSGDTVALNLEPGEYTFTVGKPQVFDVRPVVAQASFSKAVSSSQSKTYFPVSGESWGTMMVEDYFPVKGDMDMNDIVADYNLTYRTKSIGGKIYVESLLLRVLPRAVGSNIRKSGLALNMKGDYDRSVISTVKGQIFRGSGLFEVENVVEAGTSGSLVIPIIDDLRYWFVDWDGELFVNTDIEKEYVSPGENSVEGGSGTYIAVTVSFKPGKVLLSDVQLAKTDGNERYMDLFAVVSERGKEIHRKGYAPTSKIDASYADTKYTTEDNWVWVLLTDAHAKYAIEHIKIYDVFPKFSEWLAGDESALYWFDDADANKNLIYAKGREEQKK